jgi:phenylacetate-coenzyme A ligase PaaK-like adenylate-forming protein
MMEHFDELVTDRAVRLSDADAFLRGEPGDRLFLDRYVVLSTSGSTGRRGVFLFDPAEWLTALAMITRPMAWAGLTRSAFKPPRSAMVASTTPWHYSTRISRSLSSRILPALRLDAAESLDTIVSRLNDWQPEVLAVYPSVLRQLADAQLRGQLRIQLQSVATSAEVLPEETRRLVKEAVGAAGVRHVRGDRVRADLGRVCVRSQAPVRRRSHHRDRRRGRTAGAAGVSGDRILLTIFDRRTQPLIRYEISDMVTPIEGACECGRPFRLIESIEGRTEDILYFADRAGQPDVIAIHPNLFHGVLEAVPATGWQVVQNESGLSVLLTGIRDESICEPLVTQLSQALAQLGALPGAIRVRRVDALPRGATAKRLSSSENRPLSPSCGGSAFGRTGPTKVGWVPRGGPPGEKRTRRVHRVK